MMQDQYSGGTCLTAQFTGQSCRQMMPLSGTVEFSMRKSRFDDQKMGIPCQSDNFLTILRGGCSIGNINDFHASFTMANGLFQNPQRHSLETTFHQWHLQFMTVRCSASDQALELSEPGPRLIFMSN